MTIEELKERNFAGKNVLIIGCPASGKTFVAKELAITSCQDIIHTDDYSKHGYQDALYKVMDSIKVAEDPIIVEGILGYRLLRKGVELDCYYPDVVIELLVTTQRMLKTYAKERGGKDATRLKGFNAAHQTILEEYRRMPNKHRPEWIKVKNEY